jgi:hypothetical protein
MALAGSGGESTEKKTYLLYIAHCEKSFFVLASRQKIPVLRTENPALDTRTIFLLPIEFV